MFHRCLLLVLPLTSPHPTQPTQSGVGEEGCADTQGQIGPDPRANVELTLLPPLHSLRCASRRRDFASAPSTAGNDNPAYKSLDPVCSYLAASVAGSWTGLLVRGVVERLASALGRATALDVWRPECRQHWRGKGNTAK